MHARCCKTLVGKGEVEIMDSSGPLIATFLEYYKLTTNFTSLQDCLIDYVSWQYFGFGISLVQYVLPGTDDVVARSSDVYMADLVRNLSSYYGEGDFVANLSKISLAVALFPVVQVITATTTSSSSIAVSVVFNVGTKTFFTGSSPTNQQAQVWLNAFFQDSFGRYSRGGEPVGTLQQCVVLSTSSVVSSTSKNVLQVTCQVKPTFTMLLLGLSTSSLAYDWTEASFRQVFGQSSGLPSSIAMPTCNASSSSCECTYYVVLYDANQNYVECPGSALYYCQYNTQCLCVVTRAVPEGTAMKDRINSRFAQCFDLACSQTSVDCSSECSQAKAWLSDPNWYSTFINPASLDVTAVQRVCDFEVAQVPMTRQP